MECIYTVPDHVRQRVLQVGSEPTNQAEHTIQRSGISLPQESEAIGATSTRSVIIIRSEANASSRSSTARQQISINARSNNKEEYVRGDTTKSIDTYVVVGHDVEVTNVNPLTHNVEFHGKTSSITFLAALQPKTHQNASDISTEDTSLASIIHDDAFSPEEAVSVQNETVLLQSGRYYFRQARIFLEAYFQSLPFIHPILDRRPFMTSCEDLWFGKAEQQSRSFVALYYSIMSLGVLIKTWDEDKLDGLGRLEWSRKFFILTRTALRVLASTITLESVQCLFFMAKVCQNGLNPSLDYLYLGWATRSSFSAGVNRTPTTTDETSTKDDTQIAKLWWGLYSLEIEVSFALGRPDSLSLYAYHNQAMPKLDDTETAIVTVMVHFARIIRKVSMSLYLCGDTLQEKTVKAAEIEGKMENWLQIIPSLIRPSVLEKSRNLKITKDPTWVKRQRLVLELRFYNVKMILFRPFLTLAAKYNTVITPDVRQAVVKCVDAATSAIELMHDMYSTIHSSEHGGYNTTYTLYAASVVLCFGLKVADEEERSSYIELGGKAVEILDAMEESAVARNASKAIKQILASTSEPSESEAIDANNDKVTHVTESSNKAEPNSFADIGDEGLMSFLNLDGNVDFFDLTYRLDSSHLPFWDDSCENQS